MVAARLDEAAATPTVTLRGLIAACRQESSGVSERRRLAERSRKVKYTRASPELAIFATRPRRVRCVVYSVQCQVCVPSWCVLGRSRWCVSSQCSVSVLVHRQLEPIDRMMMLAQKSIRHVAAQKELLCSRTIHKRWKRHRRARQPGVGPGGPRSRIPRLRLQRCSRGAPRAPKMGPVAARRAVVPLRHTRVLHARAARITYGHRCARGARPYKRPTPYESQTFRIDTPELGRCT